MLGPASEEMVRVLFASLGAEDPLLRENAADALGRLRVGAAVKPLTKLLETERNYRIRSAICDSLGQIGDRGALGALKAKVADKNEVELVKARPRPRWRWRACTIAGAASTSSTS
jgi:HEAT repeat protein